MGRPYETGLVHVTRIDVALFSHGTCCSTGTAGFVGAMPSSVTTNSQSDHGEEPADELACSRKAKLVFGCKLVIR